MKSASLQSSEDGFVFFGIETEKLGLEVGNGLPSWKFNDQLFPCDVCGKVFGRQQTLSRHLSLHTGKAGLACAGHSLSLGNSVGFVSERRKMVRRGVCEPFSAHLGQSQAQEQDIASEQAGGVNILFLCSLRETSPYKTC